jgi:hypothetical protein
MTRFFPWTARDGWLAPGAAVWSILARLVTSTATPAWAIGRKGRDCSGIWLKGCEESPESRVIAVIARNRRDQSPSLRFHQGSSCVQQSFSCLSDYGDYGAIPRDSGDLSPTVPVCSASVC